MVQGTPTAPESGRQRMLRRLARKRQDLHTCFRLMPTDRRARLHFEQYPPVLIVGSPRSGTTLLLQVLSAQPRFTRSFEPFRIWEQVFGRMPDDSFPRKPTLAQRMRLRTEYFSQLEPDRPVLVAKDPRDSLRVDALRRVFPDARFIHIVRDGRDVVASIVQAFARGGIYHVEPGWAHVRFPGYRAMFHDPHHRKAAHMWRHCVDAVTRDFEKIPAGNKATVRYEDLLEHPEKEATRLLDMISPDYSREALKAVLPFISKTVGADRGGGAAQAGGGFGADWAKSGVAFDAGSGTLSTSVRVGKWQSELEPEALAECEAIMGPAMARFGYK